MSQTYNEQPATPHRNPSDDKWWRSALDLAAAAVSHHAYERDGEEPAWSDAVMNASAAVSMGWRKDRWANVPSGPVVDVVKAFSERLAEEYGGQDRIPHQIDTHESLPNVREAMRRGRVDETLRAAAGSIVESADPPSAGSYHPPDPAAIDAVRNAMSATMIEARFNETGQSPQAAEENFGRRLGTAAADAGIQAMNGVLADRANQELARSVQQTLGAQTTVGLTISSHRTSDAEARPAATQAKSAPQLGPRS